MAEKTDKELESMAYDLGDAPSDRHSQTARLSYHSGFIHGFIEGWRKCLQWIQGGKKE